MHINVLCSESKYGEESILDTSLQSNVSFKTNSGFSYLVPQWMELTASVVLIREFPYFRDKGIPPKEISLLRNQLLRTEGVSVLSPLTTQIIIFVHLTHVRVK